MKKEKKYSILQVANIVDMEGLDYSITGYMGPESIADKKLSELWKQAQKILEEIQEILDNARDKE